MSRIQQARELGRAGAASLAAEGARAVAGLQFAKRLGRRAQDAAYQATDDARGAVDRHRDAAAVSLQSLVDALRTTGRGRGRGRRTAVIAGGSGLALTAALGLGVALGLMVSRKLQAKQAGGTPAAKPSPFAARSESRSFGGKAAGPAFDQQLSKQAGADGFYGENAPGQAAPVDEAEVHMAEAGRDPRG
jgi:hypothetical protein